VEISANEVYRWPRFPIEVLAGPVNLAKFVAVIDRLASEPRPTVDVVKV
jgi:hypothetical protein